MNRFPIALIGAVVRGSGAISRAVLGCVVFGAVVGATFSLATAQTQGATTLAQPLVAARSELPPEPSPGVCHAQVVVPSKTRNIAKRVLQKEASEELIVSEAQYRWVEREVEIEAEAEELELIEAKFETQKREVVVEPAREEVKVVPATYKTVTDRVKVRDAYQAWTPGTGPIQRYDHATGQILCYCTIPAEYKDVERQVVDAPARVERTEIPAKTEVIEVRVMVEPPRVRRVVIPPKTKTIKVREEVQPLRVTRKPIAAEYATVLEEVKGEDSRLEWRPVLCEPDEKPDLIKSVQKALDDAGFDPGPIDGALGRQTMLAIDAYQRQNSLARDHLTIETIEHLGLDPNT